MKGIITILVLLFHSYSFGQSGKPIVYSLFNPVPKERMRSMETDRPDVTESPYTVDAGHVQLESDLFRYKGSDASDEYKHQYLFVPLTIKLGLTQHIDFQASLESYRSEYHKKDAEPEEHYGSYGSLSLRMKANLSGNDSGKFALAVLPYIKMPANSFFDHHKLEGGLLLPAQWKIRQKLSIGFQEELDIVAEEEEYELQGVQSLAVSYDILEKLKVIGETYYVYHFSEHQLENFINVAFQFSPWDNFALDGGMIQGLQPGSEHHYYLGIACRW